MGNPNATADAIINWPETQDLRVTARRHIDTHGNANPFPFPLHVMAGTSDPPCCYNTCGPVVPLSTHGIYHDPNGNGKSLVFFNLIDSALCGIPVARVLRGDIEGLEGRNELVELDPSSGSIRLPIEVSHPFPASSSHKLTCIGSGPATEESRLRSA